MGEQIVGPNLSIANVGSFSNALRTESVTDGYATFSYAYTGNNMTQMVRWVGAGSEVRDFSYNANNLPVHTTSWY